MQIKDFEECLQLRIGEVNCKGSNDEKKVVYKGIKGERASKMKRLFTSIGDYGMESYKTSLVLPTVEKFGYLGEEKLGSEIKVNNNNVSHAFRLGAIDKVGKKNYILTEIGNEIKINPDKFSKIFKEQMLKYSIYNDEEGNFIFPYRTWLEVLKEVKCIRKIDFLYCLYPLRDTSELTIDCVVENIKMLQETYKKPEVLSDENRQKVLEILNQKFDVDYGFQDVWTTKTACYNQWRYFMNHLSEFTDAVEISKDKGSVLLASGGAVNISDMLSNTKNIEDYTTFEEMRSNYKKI